MLVDHSVSYTLSGVKCILSGKLLYYTGCPAWYSVMTKMGESGQGEAPDRGHQYDSYWCMEEIPQHCKAITLQLKNELKVWNIKLLQSCINVMAFQSNLKT